MKFFSKLNFLVLSLILCFFLAGTVFAIKPLKETPPPDLPKDAKPEKKEVLEEVKEIVKKETKLTIERLHPEKVKIGEIVEISLKISNLGKEKVEFFVTEIHKPDFEYLDPIEVKKFKYQAFEVPYYGFKLSLEPKQETEIKYHVKPRRLGMVLFSPAIINDEYGNNFESVPTTLEINCNPNGKCEAGENYIFCSEDCSTGSKDGICDGAKDGKCDPDCQKGTDPDCQKPKEISKLYIIIGIIVVLAVGAILIPRFLKKKKKAM